MARSVAGSTALSRPMPSPRMRPLTRRRARARGWRASHPSSSRRSTSRRTTSRRAASPRPSRSRHTTASTSRRWSASRSAVSLAMISARRSLRSPRSRAARVSGRSVSSARARVSLRRPSCGDSRRASPISWPRPASGLGQRRRVGSRIRRAWSWAWRCWSSSWVMRACWAQIADLRRSSASIWSMTSPGSTATGMASRVVRRARTGSRAPWRRPASGSWHLLEHVDPSLCAPTTSPQDRDKMRGRLDA